MLDRLPRSQRNLALGALALLAAWGAWVVREILNPLVAAYVLAYIAHPLVLRLEGRGWSRQRSVNTIYAVLAVVTAGTLVAVWAQGSHLAARVLDPNAGLLATLDLRLGEFLEGHRDSWWLAWLGAGESGDGEGSALMLMAQQLWAEFGTGREGDLAATGAGALGHFFGSAAGLLSLIVLTPIYAWYLLFELERIHAVVRRFVPAPEQERVARIASSIGRVLTAFFRGRLTICALKGVLLSLGLLVVGAPYAVFLGMTSGFASLAPFVGSLAGYLFSFLVALLEPGADLGLTLLFVSAVFGLAEVVEGYVLMPRILGDSLGLHPLFVFVAIFIGGATLGMFGFLLALPLAASALILFRELVLPALEQFAAGGGGDAEGAGSSHGPRGAEGTDDAEPGGGAAVPPSDGA